MGTESGALAARLKEARLKTAVRLGETVSQERMAELVSGVLPSRRTVFQAQWSLYERGESEPPLDVIRAAAAVSGLDAAYLAFGTAGAIPDAIADGELVARPAPPRRGAAPATKRRTGGR